MAVVEWIVGGSALNEILDTFSTSMLASLSQGLTATVINVRAQLNEQLDTVDVSASRTDNQLIIVRQADVRTQIVASNINNVASHIMLYDVPEKSFIVTCIQVRAIVLQPKYDFKRMVSMCTFNNWRVVSCADLAASVDQQTQCLIIDCR